MRIDVNDILVAVGALLVAGGFAWALPPVALIWTGLVLLVVGLLRATRTRR